MFVSSMLISLGFVINSLIGFESTVCHNSVESATWKDPACAFQAALIYMGALTGIFFWVAISVHSLLALMLTSATENGFGLWTMLLTHALCWGVPAVGLFVLFLTDSIGTTNHSFCFIQASIGSDGLRDDYTKKWILFTAPILLGLLLGLLTLIGLLLNLKRIQADKAANRMRLRILLFAGIFTFLYGVVVVYEVYQTANLNSLKDGQVNWAKCSTVEAKECPPQGQANVALYWAFIICVLIQGVALLLLFGTTRSTWSAAKHASQRIITGRPYDESVDAPYSALRS